jgi:hypothetical protein
MSKPLRLKITLEGSNSPPVHVSLDGSNGYDLQVKEGRPITVEFKEDLVLAGNPLVPMRPILRIERGDPDAELDVPRYDP